MSTLTDRPVKQKIIYKYPLTLFGHGTSTKVAMDAEAKILTAQFQNGGLTLAVWAEIDPNNIKLRYHEFVAYFTDVNFDSPDTATGMKYLSTTTDVNGLVYHVYYKKLPGYVG